MYESSLTFGIRLFDTSATKNPDFFTALRIYSENMGPTSKTDVNQIVYWIERLELFKPDYILSYGLYRNGIIIGFALAFYIAEEKLLIIDHLVIDPNYRSNGSFFQFADLIKNHVNDKGLFIDYAAVEVVDSEFGQTMLFESNLLVRLLKLIGFKAAVVKYYIPNTEIINCKIKVNGTLMLYSSEGAAFIRTEYYLKVVSAILFKLYHKWYKPFFMERIKEYDDALNDILSIYKTSLARSDKVELNGIKHLAYVPEHKKGEIVSNPMDPAIRTILLSFATVIASWLIGILLMNKFNISMYLGIVILVVFSLVFLFMASIWIPDARITTREAVKVLKTLLANKKNVR